VRLGHRAYWSFNLYPAAGEGGGCFVPTLRARPSEGGAAAVDGERAQMEAARRARSKLRRYCAANRLNRFATDEAEAILAERYTRLTEAGYPPTSALIAATHIELDIEVAEQLVHDAQPGFSACTIF